MSLFLTLVVMLIIFFVLLEIVERVAEYRYKKRHFKQTERYRRDI